MIKENIKYKVDGYINKWEVIDSYKDYVLLENCTYGDETCYLVVDKNQDTVMKGYKLKNGETIELETIVSNNIYETYDDIITCLNDNNLNYE